MAYLLNAAYLLLLLAASPWLVWQALRKGKYREGYAAKFLGQVPLRTSDAPCVWLHAVSVGEVNLLAPLVAEIKRRLPGHECVISTTTMTGMELGRRKYPELCVFYCPLDFSWAVRRAMRRIRPRALVLAELELWPNLIRAARRHGAAVAVVNGRLGERSFRGYRRIRPLVASLLREIGLIAAQDEAGAERFRALGARPETVHITGSMKYDGAQSDRGNPQTTRLRALAGIRDEDIVFLAGSTQEPEEALALETFRTLAIEHPRLRLIIVPRHPDRFESVARLLDDSGLPWQRRSNLDGDRVARPEERRAWSTPEHERLPSGSAPRILLVDAVGELGAWWGAAAIAYVGGSMGNRGGQNMIEPAAYGAAVSFGPNTWNFRDIVAALLAHDAAVVVPDGPALTAFVRRCIESPDYAAALGERARSFVAAQLGATARTVHLLTALVGQADAQPDTAAAA